MLRIARLMSLWAASSNIGWGFDEGFMRSRQISTKVGVDSALRNML